MSCEYCGGVLGEQDHGVVHDDVQDCADQLKRDLAAAQEREKALAMALEACIEDGDGEPEAEGLYGLGLMAGRAQVDDLITDRCIELADHIEALATAALAVHRAALSASPAPAPSAEPTVTATPEAVARDEALGLRAPPPPPEPAAPLDVEAIRRRCDAATGGPWVKCAHGQAGHEDWWSVNRGVDTGRVVEAMPSQVARVLSHSRGAEDAAFIAHARTDVPRLLAEIARLRSAPTAEGLTARELDRLVAFLQTGADLGHSEALALLPRIRALASKAPR